MEANTTRILVAEDDEHIAALITAYLEREGYEVAVARDGADALRLTAHLAPAALILDLMLPKVDGWDVCRRVRAYSDVPILMLTARGEEMDRLLGFALGTDDYVVKPFSPRELVQRINAILRRAGVRTRGSAARLEAGGLLLIPEKRMVSLNNKALSLTDKEYRLLQLLMSQPGRVFTRPLLLQHLNPHGEMVVERAIDVHVGHLRQKLGESSSRPHYIETVRGVGYRFSEAAARRT